MKDKAKQAEYMRKLHYRRKYGQDVDYYDYMLVMQNGVCAVCGRTDNFHHKHFDIDHNHYTKKPRGLLCTACNRLVGKVEAGNAQSEKVENYLAFFVDIDL